MALGPYRGNIMKNCPCGSQKQYEACCGPIHDDHKKALSAENLMRARYSAFVKNKVEFIDKTNVPGTEDFNIEDAKRWSSESKWDHLEIVNTIDGQKDDTTGVVEFKAFYNDTEDKEHIHHEVADFKKIDDLWYYTEGKIMGIGTVRREGPKVGRNEPCPCGSGKKYKKCHGKA